MNTVLVTGANRGIGLEFAKQYAADGWRVIGACRDPKNADELGAIDGEVTRLELDVADAGSVAAMARALEGAPVDLLINNAGVFGQRGAGVGETDYETWNRTFEVNVAGAMRVLEALMPNLRAGKGKTVVNISSGMGSIERAGPGNHVYRSSKAALNMTMRSVAAELAGEGFIVTLQSPGWVRTDMGGASASLSPEESVTGMRKVIGALTPADNGGYFAYDGDPIPW